MTSEAQVMTRGIEEKVVLRVDQTGHVRAANDAGRQWCESVGSMACRRVVGARDHRGRAVCTDDCAIKMAQGQSPPASRQVVVRGRLTQLDCERIGDEVVVVAKRGQDHPVERLTPREVDVLQLVVQGMTTKQISGQLGIHPSTVKTHVEHACQRLGAHSRAEAVARAMRSGQI